MRFALYLGCTVPIRTPNYEISARKLAKKIGIEFIDIPEFTCCGFPVKPVSVNMAMLMATYNLALAEEKSLDICTLCSACTSTLTEVVYKLNKDNGLKKKINLQLEKIGKKYEGRIKVKHFARILYEDVGIERLKKFVKVPLNGFRFAAHYGCHYLKPSEIYDGFDNPERPVSLDKMIEITGAQSVDYKEKNLCCGGGILGIDENIALKMASEKLENIEGADAMVLICPFCSVMYEANQRQINKRFSSDINLPVLFLPQILGLSMGIPEEEMGFRFNKVKTKSLLEKLKHSDREKVIEKA
ncbi:MAG: hypothetical protein B5M53_00200 [Candidatus Cloacimonas sp. 4484_209]|nr:MAG: hypothetical protein B5M53_00200 [Candidatus Cloacimonas sp. 4484_209]